MGEHLQSRQDGAAGVLVGRQGRPSLDTRKDRRHRDAAPSQRPRGARLWPVRPPRGAAILRGRQGTRDPASEARALSKEPGAHTIARSGDCRKMNDETAKLATAAMAVSSAAF